MNGIHDMGGMHGFGPLEAEPEGTEPVFHAEWEKRVLALNMAASGLGLWNIDMGRHARERQHPVAYLRNSYYENWLAGLETLLLDAGLVTAEELASGRAAGPADPAVRKRVVPPERVLPALANGRPVDMEIESPPRFAPGDPVRVHDLNPTGHTRAPRYVRGRAGTVNLHHGAHVFPDRNANGETVGHHLYSVRFDAATLWGAAHGTRDAVLVDLWEPYLEPA